MSFNIKTTPELDERIECLRNFHIIKSKQELVTMAINDMYWRTKATIQVSPKLLRPLDEIVDKQAHHFKNQRDVIEKLVMRHYRDNVETVSQVTEEEYRELKKKQDKEA